MRPPEWRDATLGHPAVGLPLAGLGCFILYQWALDMALWPVGIGAVIVLRAVALASAKRAKFLAWKRAWDSYDDTVPASRNRVGGNIVLAVLLLVMGLYMASHADQPGYRTGLALMLIIVVGGSIALLARRVFQRLAQHRSSRTNTVTICIRRPVVAVPSLAQAFNALPDYCQRLG